jgi:hypothetical protein
VAVKPDRRGAPTIAGRVLLACGGFIASDELITQHCPAVAGLPVGGPALATGDGLRFAVDAGARTRALEGCDVTALFALPAQLEVPAALLDLGGILVNQAGHRFGDERMDALALAQLVRAQPGPSPIWCSTTALRPRQASIPSSSTSSCRARPAWRHRERPGQAARAERRGLDEAIVGDRSRPRCARSVSPGRGCARSEGWWWMPGLACWAGAGSRFLGSMPREAWRLRSHRRVGRGSRRWPRWGSAG